MGEVWLARLERAINGAIVAEVAVQPAWWRVSRRATLRAYEACRAHGLQREADAIVDRAIGTLLRMHAEAERQGASPA